MNPLNRRLRRLAACLPVLMLIESPAHAQSLEPQDNLQVRLGASLRQRVTKKWQLWLSPELRTKERQLDRYLLDFAVGYKASKYLHLRALMRGDLNRSNDGLGYGVRPGLAATGRLPLDTVEVGLRLMYTFDTGYLRDDEQRLRYRATLEYDVPDVPLDVEGEIEAFHHLVKQEVFKMRYGLQLGYKLVNAKQADHFVYCGYRLDYYLDQPRNVHIPEVGYKLHL